MRDILLLHAQRYPAMKAEDAVKLCYQSEFGGGHLAPSREDCESGIREERMAAEPLPENVPLLEKIGGGLLRLHLNAKGAKTLCSETIAGLFLAVSDIPRGSRTGFLEKIEILRELCKKGEMPISPVELETFLAGYEKAGYPLCRHSEEYRRVYQPAYRLAGEESARFLPLLQALDKRLMAGETVTLAIDGPSGSGKSSLAKWLKKVYGDCEVFHMDDFFLPPEKKSPERLSTPGGNVDWERFLEEVLVPIKEGKPFSYRPYDCGECALSDAVTATPRQLNLVEGVYSLHPALREAYDFKLFLSIDRQEQLQRILERNGPHMQQRFIKEWIPLEDLYFETMSIKDASDLIL